MTIGTRQLPRTSSGVRSRFASDSTPRISRTIVSVSGWSALLITITSGISITPGLQRLDRVARARHQHEHDRVGVVDDVDLGLADADGLDEHVLAPGGVEQQRRLQRRLGEAAERAAVGHRADEDALVEEVLGEADAVAEQRAVGERRGRVDREHADGAAGLAARLGERADQRRLADAGRPGEADDLGVPGVRVDLADELPALGAVVLDERDRARERAAVAVEQALCEASARSSSAHHRRGRRLASLRVPLRSGGDGAARRRTPMPPEQTGATRVRRPPAPLHGGPLALLRFMRAQRDAHARATRGCSLRLAG